MFRVLYVVFGIDESTLKAVMQPGDMNIQESVLSVVECCRCASPPPIVDCLHLVTTNQDFERGLLYFT